MSAATSFYEEDELVAFGFKKVGKNVLISRKASLYGAGNFSIGSNVRIDDFCLLSGNIVIGDYVHIAAYSAIIAGEASVTLEDFSGLSSRVTIYAASDDYSGAFLTNPTVPAAFRNILSAAITVGRHAIVGTGATLLPGAHLGEGVAVGAHSLVTKPAEAWYIYAGIPARKLKPRNKDCLEKEKQLRAQT